MEGVCFWKKKKNVLVNNLRKTLHGMNKCKDDLYLKNISLIKK